MHQNITSELIRKWRISERNLTIFAFQTTDKLSFIRESQPSWKLKVKESLSFKQNKANKHSASAQTPDPTDMTTRLQQPQQRTTCHQPHHQPTICHHPHSDEAPTFTRSVRIWDSREAKSMDSPSHNNITCHHSEKRASAKLGKFFIQKIAPPSPWRVNKFP